MIKELEPHHHHIDQAKKIFRDCGFTIAAMQYPRSQEALDRLCACYRAPTGWEPPIGWHWFPNAYMRDNWRKYY